MSLSSIFINRPITTTLLAIGVALSGILGFYLLPVAPMPQVEFPVIMIQGSLPGASPEIMATSIAAPIERQLSRIAGINDMTSTSSLGAVKIIVQFDLSRNINGAARDVQAAIDAAAADLPINLPSKPTYIKVNPSDSPIMILTLSSDTYTIDRIYDYTSTELQQRVLQVEGVGRVLLGGASLPAVRIETNPTKLNQYGISLTDIKNIINGANNNSAKGQITSDTRSSDITANDQLMIAKEYEKLIISYDNGNVVRLSDVAEVKDSVQDVRNGASLNGQKVVALVIFKEPGANVIETVKRINTALPLLKNMIPSGVDINVVMDRTTTIKAALRDVERTMIISIILVIAVVYLFLGNVRAMLIPSIAMVLSLLGTFGIMKLLGFSLNNLSLMALTISTGFVVDDAIVVLENISRHIESGMKPKEAAIKGAKEIAFTVISISISLIAVFIPILCMDGIVGRIFREFAITLSIAILISLIVSLTLTPMMCSRFLKTNDYKQKTSHLKYFYKLSLMKVLNHKKLMMFVILSTICLNILLFIKVPKGFFPDQDTGRIVSTIVTDQSTSFQALSSKFTTLIDIIKKDPAVKNVVGLIGSGNTNSGSIFIILKDINERKISANEVIARLRGKLSDIAGISLYMQSSQDLIIGAKQSNAQFQYTISGDSIGQVNKYAPIIMNKISNIPGVIDLNNDQRDHGLESYVKVNYDRAAALNVTIQEVDDTLYYAFGQSIASTIYKDMNQYHVVLEVAPKYSQDPKSLDLIYVKSMYGKLIPLSAFASFQRTSTLLTVNHQGLAPSATLSFNLKPGAPLGNIVNLITDAVKELNLPSEIHGSFRGTAEAFQDSLKNEPYLIIAAFIAVYIVLGILYENLIHPITIISTLPSAGVGALLALLITKTDLSVIAIIGLILLIGIVKKNAIMMIDFVIEIKNQSEISSQDAIFKAAALRFRPIMMTTMSAILGALPLAMGSGIGAEIMNPLGITIIGGLIVSQVLTLYTIPVMYLTMEKLAGAVKY